MKLKRPHQDGNDYYTTTTLRIVGTLMFFSGLLVGVAVMILIGIPQMEKINQEWQWRLEQEQADHLRTAKELQTLRATAAANGLQIF